MKGFLSISVLLLLCLSVLTGCKTNSHKDLNSNSAREMLEDHLKTENNKYGTTNVASLMRQMAQLKTLDSLRSHSQQGSDELAQIRRLLDAGYVDEIVNQINYPNVTGVYKLDYDIKRMPYAAGNPHNEWHLSMQPGSPAISGEVVQLITFNGPPHNIEMGVTGQAQENGTILLNYKRDLMSGPFSYTVRRSGNHLTLEGPDVFQNGTFTSDSEGPAPEKPISAPQYSYAFSPKGKGAIINMGGEDMVVSSKVVVDHVGDVVLGVTDTVAGADFDCHRDLTDIGRVILADEKRTCHGSVEFRKQPDGNWILSGLNL